MATTFSTPTGLLTTELRHLKFLHVHDQNCLSDIQLKHTPTYI